MGKSQDLYKKAKTMIPGGTQLLSKRPEMFLPEIWPAYYERAKGCEVWDLDGNKYTDMSIMGIGTNTLGYACDEIDAKVIEAIRKSTTSTLNCPEEVKLAEKLIELHPWAEMVRYSRTGGEAVAIAVRIARAASGKDKVAFCGYHGWNDWYLASNLADDSNLDGMLLPGLSPNGVPRGLKGTAIPFEYNKIEQLEKIFMQNDQQIGAVVMEPIRNREPENDFLNKVKALCKKNSAVLVFDEVTAGFRRVVGGIHLHYGVNPDIAVLGKALGNGYPMSAVIGNKNVMEATQATFISSTYWTERIGPVAALATIEYMEKNNVPARLENSGRYINGCWRKLFKEIGLDMEIEGLPALTHFGFKNTNDGLKYKTFITQEMLKKGYLAALSVYVCIQHEKMTVDRYIDDLAEVLLDLKKHIYENNLDQALVGPVCHSGFKRLL
jgi:glutamate-1-semialdehyde 2,1-aminomutase